ncbi:MAG: EAL domain-containing protein [Anaerolineales bacterium]|jgi:diguanylate cyclase (GGDEF)-like protein/PAS domain S-box-containing protein
MARETILVIDDNRQVANFLAHKVLPDLGYNALVAYNGYKGMELIRGSQIDILLLDLQLPDMDGMQFLNALAEAGLSLPTILMTAHGSEQIAVDAFRLGVQEYLPKPVDANTLKDAISRAMSQNRWRLEKVRLSAQLQEQINWLKVLSKVGQSLTSTLNLDEVLRRIVEAGVQLTQAEEGFLAILDKESGQLFLRAVKNIDANRVKTMHLPVTDNLLGSVVSNGKPVRTSKKNDDPGLKVSTGYLVHSLLHVPMYSKGSVMGVLSVDNQFRQRSFSERDEMILTSLADYAAVALENAGLYEQAREEIQRRRQVEDALRESEERYALAVKGANDGIWDWDLRTNQIYYSSRWKAMLGYQDNEVGGTVGEWFNRVHAEDGEHLQLDLAAHLKGMTLQFENEHRILHKDGAYRWVLSRGIAVRGQDGSATRIAGSMTDITDRKYAEAKLLHNAFYDPLTNLPNRALFLERLRFAVERAKRHADYLFAVLFLDLDRFKNVNDSMGHLAGDQLLVSISRRIEAGRRSTDTIARLGGDEFVVLLDEINGSQDATQIADWIQKTLAKPFHLEGHEVEMTASIGIVLSTNGYERTEDVLRDADIAMYTAKANGKDRYEIFDPTMRKRVLERIELEADLRHALGNQELTVYYQPIISLADGHLVGFEALARWLHPKLGLLQPSEFIPLAEETGLIIGLDRWVMGEACRQMHAWHQTIPDVSHLTISVNLSGKQIVQPDLISAIQAILEKTQLNPQRLKIEMTENVIMDNRELTVTIFKKLQALGVQVQIDDFGVGYSSLNYLSQFPINALKIDQTFVRSMNGNNSQSEIVQAIVMLTHRLGVGVIAEGMETMSQMTRLKELGCEFAQGYLVSVPLSHDATEDVLLSMEENGPDFRNWKLGVKS